MVPAVLHTLTLAMGLVNSLVMELALAQQHAVCVAPCSVIQEMKYNLDSVALYN